MLAVVAACLLRLVTASPSVETPFGRIDGQAKVPGQGEAACEEFIGIPFAEPPARFQPPEPWNKSFRDGKFSATAFGSPCLQVATIGQTPGLVGSEDCLYLNVWRPAGSSNSSHLAVMLWIHGGGFIEGASESPMIPYTSFYDGCRLAAQQGVVVVSLNYRMSIFGFGTFGPAPHGLFDANWGFQDQREGMRWVKNNVAAFGGDSKLVTVFGESAGAISVFHHLASPLSKGLFRAAIMESGLPSAVSGAYGANRTAHIAAALGCNSTQALRDCLVSANSSLLAAAAAANCKDFFSNECWGAVVDGVELQDYPDNIIVRGEGLPVPTLSGFNTNETNLFVWESFPLPMNKTQQREYLLRAFVIDKDPRATFTEKELDEVMEAYNMVYQGTDYRLAVAALLSDFTFKCGTVISGIANSMKAPAYLYRFDQRPSCPPAIAAIPGTYHSLEIPLVFGNTPPPRLPGECDFDAAEQALSDGMQERWANFAKTLLPEGTNPSLSPRWPLFTNSTRKVMLLKEPALAVEDLSSGQAETCTWLYSMLKKPPSGLQAEVVVMV
mmetsp:Transcript_13799/g.25307  ORF Transcript_13799/g.25307 Transcript_13799/m.25307 type:complete len:554 (-) Transcript_13799:95-1756(-)